MKNFIKYIFIIISVSGLMMHFSCSSDDTVIDSSPFIESVSLSMNDSLVTQGMRGNSYIIRGHNFQGLQQVFFNGYESYFNPTMVTSTVIIITIDVDTPYAGGDNLLRVVTAGGEATYNFSIEQPAPTITDFDPKAGGEGTIVTITGSVFDNLISVHFDDVEAEIVSSTSEEIQVLVPNGIVQAHIIVETTGGIATSEGQFGFRFLIYDEALNADWWVGGWGGSQDFENTENPKRGNFAVKRITEGWSGFQIGNSGDVINLTDGYNALKISIYAENAGSINVVLNGNYDAGFVTALEAGQWYDLTIPLSDLGSPETLNELVIQEFSGIGNVYFMDDIGLI